MVNKSQREKGRPLETDAAVSRQNRVNEAVEKEGIRVRGPEKINNTGHTAAGHAAENDAKALKAELESLRKQAEDEHERLLRVSAEFENYKKRMQRQVEDYRKYANESLLKELLTVVDNLERAVNCSSDAVKGESQEACVVEGVEMTLNEIMKILKKFHVTGIKAVGKPFDPVFHEAMMQEESDKYPENIVISELQKGYMIHDRLLRPALVVVSKGKPGTDKNDSED